MESLRLIVVEFWHLVVAIAPSTTADLLSVELENSVSILHRTVLRYAHAPGIAAIQMMGSNLIVQTPDGNVRCNLRPYHTLCGGFVWAVYSRTIVFRNFILALSIHALRHTGSVAVAIHSRFSRSSVQNNNSGKGWNHRLVFRRVEGYVSFCSLEKILNFEEIHRPLEVPNLPSTFCWSGMIL